MNDLGIFVLCYNRPVYVTEAIDSILNQTYKKFDLIISDNSSNELVQNSIQKYKGINNLKVLRRHPSADAISHFNLVLQEAQQYKYFMMFHDDDIMQPLCIEQLMHGFEKYPKLSASGCNAYFKYEPTKPEKIFNDKLTKDVLIINPQQLIHRYFTKSLSHTPFPFYIYSAKQIVGLTMDPNEGGKHCDVSFLCKVVERSPLLWSALPLANYRLHEANDSNEINIPDLISLTRFIFTNYHSFYIKMSFVLTKRSLKHLILLVRRIFR